MKIKCRKIIRYFNIDNIELICIYDNIKNDKLNGEYKGWYEDGQLGLQCNYKNDNPIKTKFNLK